MNELTAKLGITNYVLFMQDYGGPVGFRVALSHPERVRAIIIQNAVSHERGLSPLWEARKKYWADPVRELENLKANFTSFEATRQRHIGSSPHPDRTIPIHGRTSTYFSLVQARQPSRPRCFWITGPTSPLSRVGRTGFAKHSHQCWWFGENTTPLSRSPARQPMPTMFQARKSISSKLGISPSTKRPMRSHLSSGPSSNAWITREDKGYGFRLPHNVRCASWSGVPSPLRRAGARHAVQVSTIASTGIEPGSDSKSWPGST
jgi:hypothetical protein